MLERIVSGRTKNHQLQELLPWEWKAARAAEDMESSGMSRQSRTTEPAPAVSGIVRAPMPLDELDRWLRAPRKRRTAVSYGISMLDGFLTAIVVGPATYKPLAWLCPLIGVSKDTINDGGT